MRGRKAEREDHGMTEIALLGFGVVGSGTAEVLTENRALISARLGEEIDIR